MPKQRSLNEMLAEIVPENRHNETNCGSAVGAEFPASADNPPKYVLEDLIAGITADNLNIDSDWINAPAVGREFPNGQ